MTIKHRLRSASELRRDRGTPHPLSLIEQHARREIEKQEQVTGVIEAVALLLICWSMVFLLSLLIK